MKLPFRPQSLYCPNHYIQWPFSVTILFNLSEAPDTWVPVPSISMWQQVAKIPPEKSSPLVFSVLSGFPSPLQFHNFKNQMHSNVISLLSTLRGSNCQLTLRLWSVIRVHNFMMSMLAYVFLQKWENNAIISLRKHIHFKEWYNVWFFDATIQ